MRNLLPNAGIIASCFFLNLTASHALQSDESEELSLFTIADVESGNLTTDSLKIELKTPTTPAAAILGDDSLSLSSIRASSDFFGQVLNSVAGDGSIEPGLAIGGAPYWWFGGNETLKQYREESYFHTLLKRTQFGLATKSGTGENEDDTQIGTSLSWQLIKTHDPRHSRSGERCIASALKNAIGDNIEKQKLVDERTTRIFFDTFEVPEEQRTPEKLFELLEQNPNANEKLANIEKLAAIEIEKEIKDGTLKLQTKFKVKNYSSARNECRTKFDAYLQNTDSLVFTVASAFSASNGNAADVSNTKTALFLAYKSGEGGILKGLKLGLPVQAFAGYTLDERVELEDDIFATANQLTLGIGTSFERENVTFDLQAAYLNTNFEDDMKTNNDLRFTASYSQRIRRAVWIEAKAGFIVSNVLDSASFAGINLKVDTAALLNN